MFKLLKPYFLFAIYDTTPTKTRFNVLRFDPTDETFSEAHAYDIWSRVVWCILQNSNFYIHFDQKWVKKISKLGIPEKFRFLSSLTFCNIDLDTEGNNNLLPENRQTSQGYLVVNISRPCWPKKFLNSSWISMSVKNWQSAQPGHTICRVSLRVTSTWSFKA